MVIQGLGEVEMSSYCVNGYKVLVLQMKIVVVVMVLQHYKYIHYH